MYLAHELKRTLSFRWLQVSKDKEKTIFLYENKGKIKLNKNRLLIIFTNIITPCEIFIDNYTKISYFSYIGNMYIINNNSGKRVAINMTATYKKLKIACDFEEFNKIPF